MGSDTIILSASGLFWLAGFLILWRIRIRGPNPPYSRVSQSAGSISQSGKGIQPAGISLAEAGSKPVLSCAPSLSVIIPARNEAHNLPTLLHSINTQSFLPLEVIVVNDASTDRTAELADQLGAIVIASEPLPDGWRGKTWACQQGANAACGDLLLFVDADTWFEPDGLKQILDSYETGALSLGPYHAIRRPYEELSVFFNLIMIASTLPIGLFGQMLLVDRESYRCVGGHERVKGRTLENFYMAGHFRKFGIPVRSQTGKGLLGFRMYPNGLSELMEGWTKGFASGAGQTAWPLLLLIVAWLTGMMLPLGYLPFSAWAWLLYLLFAAQLGFVFRQVGAFRWYTALLYPVPLLFFFVLFTWSLLRSGRQVTWKGRTFHAH